MVFFIDTGGGHGHVGIVAANINASLETIEGNTNDNGSRASTSSAAASASAMRRASSAVRQV